jgi:hypothetical protein
MQATNERFANRCLPLLIANQAGWFLLNSHPIRVTWDGGNELSNLQVEYLKGFPPYPAVSHFGHGIVTWTIPYLFRTPPGYNLLVRGPSNWPKDGAHALEGIVETDWSVATFTMNWMLTRPNQPSGRRDQLRLNRRRQQQGSRSEAWRPLWLNGVVCPAWS